MTNDKPFLGVMMSEELIVRNDLTWTEKAVCAAIDHMEKDKVKWDNKTLARFCQMNQESLSNILTRLRGKGFVFKRATISDDEAFRQITERKVKGTKCAWCDVPRLTLDKHHFPIRKKHGGVKTVLICAACHRDFHLLAGY